jgi:AmmeMemoRadiSam system protein B
LRPPAVAGLFYPGEPARLRQEVRALLSAAPASGAAPKALVVPHAVYAYSGPTAAAAFARLRARRGEVRRVVLLGPAHRLSFRGLALPCADAFETPLGRVPVDGEGAARAAALPGVVQRSDAHAAEHSLEVELPFLQEALGDFSLLPLAVGNATAEEVARVLDALWGGAETSIVVSTDLSHYLEYDAAREVDRATAEDVLALRPVGYEQACGAAALNGLIAAARARGLAPRLIDLRSSGDTAGDRRRVVGYGAFALEPV